MSPFHRFYLGRRDLPSVVPAHLRQFPRDKARFLSNRTRMFRSSALLVTLVWCAFPVHAVTIPAPTLSTRVIISVRDQKLMLVENGPIAATYPVSTSMYGMTDPWH